MQAGLRRDVQSLDDDVDDRLGANVIRTWVGEFSEAEPHRGASPVVASSSSGTRNMLSAVWPCRPSHPTSSCGDSVAWMTSSSLIATHWPGKARNRSRSRMTDR